MAAAVPMRIAVFCQGFPEKPDGSYTPAVIDLLLALAARHELWVFAVGGQRPGKRVQYRFGRIHVIAMGPGRGLRGMGNYLWLLRNFFRLHHEKKFTLAHGLWHVGSLHALLFGRLGRVPVVLSMLGGEIVALPEMGYGVLTRRHWRMALRYCLSRAAAVTAGSRDYCEKIAAFAPEVRDRLHLAPLGIVPARLPLREQANGTPRKILSAAAFQPVKNIPCFLRLMQDPGLREMRLHMAGEGPLLARTAQEITDLHLQKNIVLMGWQPERPFKQALPAYDLLVSLSAHEAQGMAMIEAAAAGLPVAATPVGVAPELAALGAAVIEISDPEAAAGPVRAVLENLPVLQAQARRAVPAVRQVFSLDASMKKFEEIYRAASGGPHAAWYRDEPPLLAGFRRRLRPLVFRLLAPVQFHLRKRSADTTVAGLRLHTSLEVFHPKFFLSSRLLAAHLARLDLRAKSLLDMGTGSGLIGIVAAKAGARVLAVDINQAAVQLAARNAARHGVSDRMACRISDLFAGVAAAERFDWIVFNPPFYPGKVAGPQEAAWFAGEQFETIEWFLAQAATHLMPAGRVVLILSSDMPLEKIDAMIPTYSGYEIAAHTRCPHIFEVFHLLQLRARGAT